MLPPWVNVVFTEFAIVQVGSVWRLRQLRFPAAKITTSGAATSAFLRKPATVKCLC